MSADITLTTFIPNQKRFLKDDDGNTNSKDGDEEETGSLLFAMATPQEENPIWTGRGLKALPIEAPAESVTHVAMEEEKENRAINKNNTTTVTWKPTNRTPTEKPTGETAGRAQERQKERS